MSSAAAKAEARRKAILSRGTDRLAKLTTSARGEDAAAFMRHESPPVASHASNVRNFVGEETDMPTPPARASPAPPSRASPAPHSRVSPGPSVEDPSVWSDEQQQQLLQALMGGFGGGGGMPGLGALGGPTGADAPAGLPPGLADNPLAAMLMGGLANAGSGDGLKPPFPPIGKGPAVDTKVQAKPPSKLQKLLPLVHMLAIWALLAYFVLVREPQAHAVLKGETQAASWSSVDWQSMLRRWADLAYKSPAKVIASSGEGWTVTVIPFFWAFMTLQIALHSTRIFYGLDTPQPPALLAMVIPHLPPPFPSLVLNGLKYLSMGSTLLNDLSILAVGTGFVIWIAGLLSS